LPSIASSAPVSSPIEHICSTMLGKTLAFCIATVSDVPVETHLAWICL